MLLGLNHSSLFTETVKWQETGGSPHFSLPEFTLRKSALCEKFIITGCMGINPQLFHKIGGGPSFKVTRQTLHHYRHYYSIFLKEEYTTFREKMKFF